MFWLIYLISLHSLSVSDIRSCANVWKLIIISQKMAFSVSFVMENKERRFEQEHFFVTYRSSIDTSLIRKICSFKHLLTVFWKNCSKTRGLMLQMQKWWQKGFLMFYITIVGIWIKTKIIKIFDMYIHIKGGKSYNKLIMLVLGDILGLYHI